MSDGRKRILSPFTGRKKNLGIRLERNMCQKKEEKI